MRKDKRKELNRIYLQKQTKGNEETRHFDHEWTRIFYHGWMQIDTQ